MGEDFSLHGCWSIALIIKQTLACRRSLEQKTMEPTMPRVDLPSSLIRLREEPLQKAGNPEILNGSSALKERSVHQCWCECQNHMLSAMYSSSYPMPPLKNHTRPSKTCTLGLGATAPMTTIGAEASSTMVCWKHLKWLRKTARFLVDIFTPTSLPKQWQVAYFLHCHKYYSTYNFTWRNHRVPSLTQINYWVSQWVSP